MKPNLPYYKHVRCDYCGGAVHLGGSYYQGVCDNCGKEKNIKLGVNYDGLLNNEKTGWTYPVVERKGLIF